MWNVDVPKDVEHSPSHFSSSVCQGNLQSTTLTA
jgi:hypothetical protein